jgi:GH25 family lysozyme M1 (1,4-beta-N-acetylmuramidase)
MTSEAIERAINRVENRVERFVGNYSCVLLSPDTYDDNKSNNFIEQEIYLCHFG